METIHIPGFDNLDENCGFVKIDICSDGKFQTGKDGIQSIYRTGDKKIELISFSDRALAYVHSAVGYPAYYPIHPIVREDTTEAVLMDLDGTTVRSEEFWIWIIEKSVQSLMENPKFELTEADIPFVSGHSVTEHLKYCIEKYCPDRSLEKAREYYFYHTNLEM